MASSIDLLERLTQADGVPGFEDEVRDCFIEATGNDGIEWLRDRSGSVIAKKTGTAVRPHVMLDCHLDEVGFIVQHIAPTGFLKFLPLGGWWAHILPAQRVSVGAGDRKLPGVIGSTPPHFLPPERRSQVLDIRDMFIDIGAASREEAEEWGVRVGSWVAPYSPFVRLTNQKHLLAKAFDNRVGCALCVETVRDASGHPNTLFGSASAMEEVGTRGARTAAEVIDPDVAIVLECPPADDTLGFNPDESQGALGQGVQLRVYDPTMIANPKFVEFTTDVAREEGIRHQITVRASGGTNAGPIHVHNRGVPSIVIGVPARYIHGHTSILHTDDYDAAVRLVASLVQRLDADTVASFSS